MKLERSPIIVVFSLYPEIHACPVIRIISPLVANNCKIIWGAEFLNSKWKFDFEAARSCDLIIIQRHFPAVFTEQLLDKLLKLNIPIAYELDDMLVDLPYFHTSHKFLKKHYPYIKWILRTSDVIIASTPALQNSLKKYTTRPIHLQPNLVSWDLFNSIPKPHNDQFTFLISGTSTHKEDWSIIVEPLLRILDIYPNSVNAIFFGDAPEKLANHLSVRTIKFQDGYLKYAARLKELDVNCALVPLEDTPFNNCKSNIKWLEYSAAGIPGIYSNAPPYRSSVNNGETGLLVNNTTEEWFQAMNQLIKNPDLALNMVDKARIEVRNKYSVESSSADYEKYIYSLIGKKHERNLFYELSIAPTRFKEKTKICILHFLNKYFLWRFKRI